MPNCYYYDEQRNHCKCYVNENLNELLAENAKLLELVNGLEYCVRTPVCDCCCPLYDPSGTNYRRCESLERELRIEVES